MSVLAFASIMPTIDVYLLISIGAPDSFVFIVLEILSLGHLMEQFYLDLLVGMGK